MSEKGRVAGFLFFGGGGGFLLEREWYVVGGLGVWELGRGNHGSRHRWLVCCRIDHDTG